MTMTTSTFDVRPITEAVLAELRGLDDAGRPPRVVPDDGGAPLRCCLRRSEGGEDIVLVGYAPVRRWAHETGAEPGPYDEVGPVFIHATSCDGPVGHGLPHGLLGGPRVLRSYNENGEILGGRLFDRDDDPERLIADLLTDPEVAVVHLRFAEFGCFIAELRPLGPRS